MFVNRSATGDLSGPDNWNRTWGADARVGVGEYFTLAGFGAAPRRLDSPAATLPSTSTRNTTMGSIGPCSSTGAPARTSIPRSASSRRRSATADSTWALRDDAAGEDPRLGIPRVGAAHQLHALRLPGWRSAERRAPLDNHWDWENGNRIDTALNGTWEGFVEPFEIYPGVVVPVGEHGGLRFGAERRIPTGGGGSSRELEWDVGTFLTGTENSPSVEVIIRDGGRFTVDTTGRIDRSRCRKARSTPIWATCG